MYTLIFYDFWDKYEKETIQHNHRFWSKAFWFLLESEIKEFQNIKNNNYNENSLFKNNFNITRSLSLVWKRRNYEKDFLESNISREIKFKEMFIEIIKLDLV